jgi:hypothetical protein
MGPDGGLDGGPDGARQRAKRGKTGWRQGCLNGRPMVKFTVWTSAHVRFYLADVFLPVDGF